ncbi:MAG: glycerol kinase GlpK [Hyphomicrobiales bacterium]|nr:glycerol kinase GlpK [Hyphomicrobiales bacterium]
MGEYVGALDQGTTSTRFIIFDRQARLIAQAQREHAQICPGPGLVEHDALEIWRNVGAVIDEALRAAGLEAGDLDTIGITNQRETAVLWDRATGEPLHHALVWMDTRTSALVAQFARDGGIDRLRARTGLPLATYFSGLKLLWLLENVPGARARAARGEIAFGTIDSWLVWQLTGGPGGGVHITDVTNASRTQLMNLETLTWDEDILRLFDIPRACLPEIRSSSEHYGMARLAGGEVPVTGILGDQQAALFGQACLAPGAVKNTYGTGCFMLMNIGAVPQASTCGLLTTVGYRLGKDKPVYALEGSVAIAGAAVQWLRDNLGIVAHAGEVEALAASVPDNGDVYFVPAFSGLYAPHWQERARGAIAGLTRYATKAHLARATLEATAFQVNDVLHAMERDSHVAISELRCDGGMTVNQLLMQTQADLSKVPVIRPKIIETTALGAAYAAGLATGLFSSTAAIAQNWREERRWVPMIGQAARNRLLHGWDKALARAADWVDV